MSVLEWIGVTALVGVVYWLAFVIHTRWPVWAMHFAMCRADRQRRKLEDK